VVYNTRLYILVRIGDHKYVAVPGLEHSYTDDLLSARIFLSLEAAERERCVDNESICEIVCRNGRLGLE
jgi:hypothetical protein